jgi:hypothetical protein
MSTEAGWSHGFNQAFRSGYGHAAQSRDGSQVYMRKHRAWCSSACDVQGCDNYREQSVKAEVVKAPSPAHRNEDDGEPCKCNIPASDPERAYYQCNRISVRERRRRWETRDYREGWAKITARLGELDARQIRAMAEGTGPDTVQGQEAGQQEQATNPAGGTLPLLPSPDRPMVGETASNEGRDTSTPQAGGSVRPGAGSETVRAEGIRERTGPSEEPGRTATVEESEAMAPRVLPQPGMSEKDRPGSPEGNQEAGTEQTVKRGGRPRLYATDADRKRAYRERQRG